MSTEMPASRPKKPQSKEIVYIFCPKFVKPQLQPKSNPIYFLLQFTPFFGSLTSPPPFWLHSVRLWARINFIKLEAPPTSHLNKTNKKARIEIKSPVTRLSSVFVWYGASEAFFLIIFQMLFSPVVFFAKTPFSFISTLYSE